MRPRAAGNGSCPAPVRWKFAFRRQQQAQAHEGALAPVGVGIAAGEAFERVASRVRAGVLAGAAHPSFDWRLRQVIEGVAHRV
jgi:hypothetical protein